MKFKYRMTILNAADIDAEAAFWAGLLDGRVDAPNDRWRNVWSDGDWQVGIQLADDHVPPTWPDDGVPLQLHFDLYVVGLDAVDAATEQVIELGGRLLKPAPDRSAAKGFQVLASPAGHPFCICWIRRTPRTEIPDDIAGDHCLAAVHAGGDLGGVGAGRGGGVRDPVPRRR